MIEAAKGVLLKFIPDVFILTDHRKGPASGLSPGYGITLTAETINGIIIIFSLYHTYCETIICFLFFLVFRLILICWSCLQLSWRWQNPISCWRFRGTGCISFTGRNLSRWMCWFNKSTPCTIADDPRTQRCFSSSSRTSLAFYVRITANPTSSVQVFIWIWTENVLSE